jgi:hypothetical protein
VSELDIALREARLAAQQLSESWEEINLLYSIGEILGRTVNLDDAARTILNEISETVEAKRAAIYVHDSGSGLLRPIAAIGSIVPTSGLACMMETRVVCGVMAFSTTAGSTSPCSSTGRRVTWKPAFSSALAVCMMEKCSIPEMRISFPLLWWAQATPLMAILLDSVPQEVK